MIVIIMSSALYFNTTSRRIEYKYTMNQSIKYSIVGGWRIFGFG